MFRRIVVEEWQSILAIASLLTLFIAFLFIVWKARRMSSQEVQRLENLPLQDDTHHD